MLWQTACSFPTCAIVATSAIGSLPAITRDSSGWVSWIRRSDGKLLGGGTQARPGAMRQRNAVALALLQNAVAARAGKKDSLDSGRRRKRKNAFAQPICLRADIIHVAERR